jgi:hypothetical protein
VICSTSIECWATEKAWGALRLAVPARHPGKPVGDVLDLDVERRGVEEIEPAARQHALPGARGVAGLWHGSGRRSEAKTAAGRVAMAADQMVVDHADGLHEGVDDGGAAEAEAPRLEVLRDGFGERRGGGTSSSAVKRLTIGLPSTKPHR